MLMQNGWVGGGGVEGLNDLKFGALIGHFLSDSERHGSERVNWQ